MYLESLEKSEAQILLHALQRVISDFSVIDQFTYSTYEQAIHGIDLVHTIAKIKLVLKQQINLK
jgi:hypothetical protein